MVRAGLDLWRAVPDGVGMPQMTRWLDWLLNGSDELTMPKTWLANHDRMNEAEVEKHLAYYEAKELKRMLALKPRRAVA
jgi:hypothetical protein